MQNDFQELVTIVFEFLYEVVSTCAKSMLSKKGAGVSREKHVWLFRSDRVEVNMKE